jgi:hypothetical protein
MHKHAGRRRVTLLSYVVFVASVTTALAGCSRGSGTPLEGPDAPAVQEGRQPRRVTPAAEWEPIFFKAIDARVGEAGLPSLRAEALPDGESEIRVWVGFGLSGEDGIVLRHSGGQWSGLYLHGMSDGPLPRKYQKALTVPKSGWETAWQRLSDAGILTLPDASAVQCSTYINDGVGYVVEINADKIYRTYLYDNPNHAQCDEAKKMMRIGEIIAEEFDLANFRIKE